MTTARLPIIFVLKKIIEKQAQILLGYCVSLGKFSLN